MPEERKDDERKGELQTKSLKMEGHEANDKPKKKKKRLKRIPIPFNTPFPALVLSEPSCQ